MKNWMAPLTVLGICGLGLACASERVQERIRIFFEHVAQSSDSLSEINKFFDEQLGAIQRTLDRLAETLNETEQEA